MKDGLTPKQKAFADYYIECGNAAGELRKTEIIYKENPNRSEKDEITIRELRKIIDFDDLVIFNTWRYRHVIDPEILIIDAYITICHEKTTKCQKEAAYEILKYLVAPKYLESWLEGNAEVWDRDDRRVRKWKEEVLKSGKCAKCGKTDNLEAHHIIHWSVYPKGRVDINNGICLCDECHAEEHKGELPYEMMKGKVAKRKGASNG